MPIRGPLPSDVIAQIRELYLAGEKVENIALERWDERARAWLRAGDFDTKGAARARAFELRMPSFRVREVAS